MGKLKFKINFRFTSEILDIHFRLSNEKDTELKPYNEPGWPDGDPGEYDDGDPDGFNWPHINYN